jgi:hypothetical protein
MATIPTRESVAAGYMDPAGFQRGALGRRLWKSQRRICEAVNNKPNIAVKGCHASGKTYVSAGLVPWWLSKNITGKVITIAPTLRQVKLMWGEISLALSTSRIAFPAPSSVGLKIAEDRYAIGISSSRGVNIQGFHGSDILVIADEAPGIEADIWESVEGIRAGGKVTVLELGNPTVPSGHFFDNFRHPDSVECITISAFDSPNLAGVTIEQLLTMSEAELDYAPWPLLTSRRWVKDRYLRWGPGNPRYISRVLGEFPGASEFSVFSLLWIERAKREPTEAELTRAEGCLMQVGIDVAGPGEDETAACARVNGIIIDRAQWSHTDANLPVANWLHRLRQTQPYEIGPVVVDVFGIGADLGIYLAQQGFPVYGFQGGKEAMEPERFLNAKSESYWRLRDMYHANYISHLPATLDEETEAQLAGIQYREVGRGLIQIEPKDEARKRGVSSPDRAEAEIMAFCRVQLRETTATFVDDEIISEV